MTRVHDILKTALLGFWTLVAVFVCLLLLQCSDFVQQLRRDETGIAAQAQTIAQAVNKPCESKNGATFNCGTLAQVDNLVGQTSNIVLQARLALKHTDDVSLAEAKMLPVWNDKITAAMDSVTQTSDTAGRSVKKLTAAALPVVQDADVTVKTTNATIASIGDVAKSQSITDTLDHVDESSKSVADSMKQADAILTDAREEADKFVHPPVKKLGFWGRVGQIGLAIHKFSPPWF